MKKKLLLVLLALVCALCCAFGLAACGGGGGGDDANKLKISVTPFEDEGIEQIFFYTADPAVMDDKDEDDDYSHFNYFQMRGNCYNSYDGPSTVKINEGTYAGVVSISIRDSHYVDGSWIYDTMAVKIKVNGTEIKLFPKKLMSDVTLPFSGDYWGLVGDEGVFSEDLTIEVIGNTTIKQFASTVTLENYEAYKNAETCQGLKFKVGIANSFASFSEMEFEPFEYNSKTEFTAAELKTAMADTNTRFTYFDHVKVTAYFENNTKFFPDSEYARAFGEKARPTGDLSLEWEMNYFNNAEDKNITLDFAVFGEAVEVHGQEQLMTLDDMTKINLRHGAAGEMFNSMFESENVKFVVDGIDKTELTLQEYYNADNVKIKSVVSDLGAVILQDQNMYVATISYFGTTNTENEKRLTQSEIIIGNAVDGKKGYKEVTFDLGNYKSFKGASYFTSIELNVYNLVPTVEGYTAMEYYTDALLQSLQKVEFENRTTGGIDLEYSHHEYHWDGLKSDPKNSESQIYYYDKEYPSWNDPLAGCYYYGDELALCVGGTDLSGMFVTTLELIISRSGESDQTIILTTEGFSDWQLSDTYEGITCEVEDYNTRLVISSGNVTKISGKLTMELKNNQDS